MMKYTMKNLEQALSEIDPVAFDIYRNKAKMSMPNILDQMFIIGFNKHLRGQHPTFMKGEAILMKAYNDIHNSPGYFQFEEE